MAPRGVIEPAELASDVTVSGTGAVAITNVAIAPGDVVLDVGDVTTQGYREDGVAVNTNNGGDGRSIDIVAGHVQTGGDAAAGIKASAYTGSVGIVADSLTTTGYGADAIYASSWEGNVSVVAGTVSAEGLGSRGVTAYSGGTTTIVVDSVMTTGAGLGTELDAGGITAVGAAVNVTAGLVSTVGDYSVGIFASSNLVHDNGQPDRDIAIVAGQVSTIGRGSDGVHVVNANEGGNILINVGSISTAGEYAWGAYALSVGGDVDLSVGSIATSGASGTGIIAASFGGDVIVKTNSVATAGDNALGIESYSATGNIVIEAGNVVTNGSGSGAISAVAPGGSIEILAEKVATSGSSGTGIYAVGGESITIGVGSLATTGDDSNGIYAVALPIGDLASGANIAIRAGSVSTTGDRSTAITTFAATPETNVAIQVGEVVTSGFGSQGVRASTLSGDVDVQVGTINTHGEFATALVAYSIYGDVTVRANEVTTLGTASNGIEVFSYTGKATVVANDVTTSGAVAGGIFVRAAEVEIHTLGSVTTNGAADAIIALAGAGGVTIRNEAIITTNPVEGGYYNVLARGMNIESQGDVLVIGNGSITTNVDASEGILASSSTGGNIAIKQRSVTTTGSGSVGLSIVSHTALGDSAGNVLVDIEDVRTSGYSSSGLLISNNTSSGDAAVRVTGAVRTAGGYSRGVGIYSANGDARAQLTTVATAGVYSDAVHLDGKSVAASVSGPIATLGDRSIGFVGYAGNGGVTFATSGSIETKGIFSSGIRVSSPGAVDLTLAGEISTSGRGASGIEVTERKRQREVYPYDPPAPAGPDLPGPRQPEPAITGSLITLRANAITTTGDRANGILASSTTGSINLATGSVRTTGIGSTAIFAEGKSIVASTGQTSSAAASAIVLKAYDSVRLDVRGQTTGTGDAVVLQGSDTAISVAANAIVSGTGNGLVINATPHVTPIVHYWGYAPVGYPGQDEPQPVPPADPPPGLATIVNGGTITGGSGYAILVSSGQAVINNSGEIRGAISLDDQDDRLTNTGTFSVTKDSDFGLGSDLLINSGIILVPAGAERNVSLHGLETLENNGGIVDLRNGRTGDVFTIGGNYVGGADATLGLNVDGRAADLLVVDGAATGHTQVVLAGTSAKDARLGGAPITVIRTGAGSSANAFSLANGNVGFIEYRLDYNAADRSYSLASEAGAAVHRSTQIGKGAERLWHKTAEVWSSQMAELRDLGDARRRLWGQLFTQVDKHDGQRARAADVSAMSRHSVGYRQQSNGAQLGYEFGSGPALSWGVTGGYLQSDLAFQGAAEKAEFNAINLGAFARYRTERWFLNGLVKYDRVAVRVQSDELDYSDRLKSQSVGAQLEGGIRLGVDQFYFEPLAGLTWLRADVDDLEALGQRIRFDSGHAIRGKIGARFGGSTDAGEAGTLHFHGSLAVVHEFAGPGGATLESGGVSDHIDTARFSPIGQGTFGLTLQTKNGFSGFLQGNADLGGGFTGFGGRIGLSLRL